MTVWLKKTITRLAISAFVSIPIICTDSAFSKPISSVCYGTTAHGRLENGVKLPSGGNNFQSYSLLAGPLGRTFVHSKVREIIIDAYRQLETAQPGKVYKYAESGYENGGPFKPHKTHQNGLSVDFTVPVVDASGKSVYLPTNLLNRWGYDIEFDKSGKYGEYAIDYESLAAHIVALHKSALRQHADIWRVIFDPGLQPFLYATKYGSYIRKNLRIPTKKSWVRHDDHYHVDFMIKCKPLPRK